MSIFSRFTNNDVLAIDVDARNLTMARFSYDGLKIKMNDFKAIRLPPFSGESFGDDYALARIEAIKEIVSMWPKTKNVRLTLDGYVFFPRFVTLPSISSDKLEQIIKYEAEQNVPFPMDEVMWDYSYRVEGDGVSAMIIAAKSENILHSVAEMTSAKLKLKSVNSKTIGLVNLARLNMKYACGKNDGSVVIMDIGDRATNIVFIEGEKFFTRSIPVAGNAITNEVVKEMNITFMEAEQLRASDKINTDIATMDVTSKITRNVMTRLQAELNRSMNFYRSQQGGTPMSKMYITGCASKIFGLQEFLSEKQGGVPVEKLNPFLAVETSHILSTASSENSHILHGVVGSAIQEYMPDMIDINLLNTKKVVQMSIKKPKNKMTICDCCPFRK